MKPTIGRIVHFHLSDFHRNMINGNESSVLPAIIVAVWSDSCVNLKVFTDGVNDLWLTSILKADEFNSKEGKWDWPVKEE